MAVVIRARWTATTSAPPQRSLRRLPAPPHFARLPRIYRQEAEQTIPVFPLSAPNAPLPRRHPRLLKGLDLMARPCSVCSHVKCKTIDTALIAGESNRSVAKRHGLSEQAIRRHHSHIQRAVRLAAETDLAEHHMQLAGGLTEQLMQIRGKLATLTAMAEASGDYKGAMQGCRELCRALELAGRFAGEISDAQAPSCVTIFYKGDPPQDHWVDQHAPAGATRLFLPYNGRDYRMRDNDDRAGVADDPKGPDA